MNTQIAIVGIGCRFPGQVQSPEEFWNVLHDKVDTISNVPESRFDIEEFYHKQPGTPGKIVTKEGGFLNDIDKFDPAFFGISPRESHFIDPQQRLLLETTWEALEDASILPSSIGNSDTGVFVGMCYNGYENLQHKQLPKQKLNIYGITGGARNLAAGRISFCLNLKGPSVVVDAAFASSLVSVHMACQSLAQQECSMAIAGGANLILEPETSISFSESKMLSPEGRCKFGDADANGFVRSEGVGVVLLKRLDDAIADRDNIYAVILGSACNNDGQNSGYLVAPSIEGQEEAIRKAHQNAGVEPKDIQYIEAHGTGTSLGDFTELSALGKVITKSENPKCYVGSVKTNIGHTEGCAGLAGLIKLALMLKKKKIPASLHCTKPNPQIDWDNAPFEIPGTLIDFPRAEESIIAGINSIGIYGVNTHMVVQSYKEDSSQNNKSSNVFAQCYALPLSAKNNKSAQLLANKYQDYLASCDAVLNDISYTSSLHRSHHNYRFGIVGKDKGDLQRQLESYSWEDKKLSKHNNTVMVFPGQGAQWHGMGKVFENHKVFRETIERCSIAMKQYVDWSLEEVLFSEEDRLQDIDIIQPVIFSTQLALAKMWESIGVVPKIAVGHSMGEVAAACVAGILSLEDAARIICLRSQLLRKISGQGAMAFIELSLSESEELIADKKLVSIAVSNGPKATVLSGCPKELEEIVTELQGREIFCRFVKVDVASHSPQVDPLKDELLKALEDIRPQKGNMPLHSTVLNRIVDASEMTNEYWVKNLREPVLFFSSMQSLFRQDYDIAIEISTHPILLNSIEEIATEGKHNVFAIHSLKRDENHQSFLEAVVQAYNAGYPIAWEKIYQGNPVALPKYQWHRDRFWIEEGESSQAGFFQQQVLSKKHSFLEKKLDIPGQNPSSIYELNISLAKFPLLQEQTIHGRNTLPTSYLVEFAVAISRDYFSGDSFVLENIQHLGLFVLEEDKNYVLRAKLEKKENEHTLEIYSIAVGDATDWEIQLSAQVALYSKDSSFTYIEPESNRQIDFYSIAEQQGYQCSPELQTIQSYQKTTAGYLLHLELPPEQETLTALGNIFQSILLVTEGNTSSREIYIPSQISQMFVKETIDKGHIHLCQAELKKQDDSYVVNLFALDDDKQVLFQLEGIAFCTASVPELPSSKEEFSEDKNIVSRWKQETPDKLRFSMEEYLKKTLAQVLHVPTSEIDTATPVKNFGVDSFMALEFRNRLKKELEIPLSGTLLFNYPTIQNVLSFLIEKLGLEKNEALADTDKDYSSTIVSESVIVQATEDELDQMLAKEFEDIEEDDWDE